MATITKNDLVAPPKLHVKTVRVTEKPSHDTMMSDAATLTPSVEKSAPASMEMPRNSGESSPRSNHLNPFDTDVEAMITNSNTPLECKRKSATKGGPDCQVWPGRDHWKQKAKAAKMKRSCGCLSHLSKRNRLMIKILIGLLIVGIAVGVGFGISKPLGAGIWHSGSS